MNLHQSQFYRKYGVLKPTALAVPLFHESKWLELPLDSCLHFVSYDGTVAGPANDDALFKNVKHAVPIRHETALKELQGPPRHVATNFEESIREYHATHRKFRRVRVLDSVLSDHLTPIVYNYGLVGRGYVYHQSVYANYYRITNMLTTVVKTINEEAATHQRNHYLILGSPRILPPIQKLVDASKQLNQQTLHSFNEANGIALLHLTRWILGEYEQSAFTHLKAAHYNKLNFIFEEDGRWFCLNFGYLASWRNPEKDDQVGHVIEQENAIKSKLKLKPYDLLLRLLRSYLSMLDATTAAHATADAAADSTLDTVTTQATDFRDIPLEELDDDQVDEVIVSETKTIEDDLKKLDEINNLDVQEKIGDVSLKDVLDEKEADAITSAIEKLSDKLVADGVISVSEHKRIQRNANSYKELVSVSGERMEDFRQIKPEKQLIEKKPKFKDSVSVLDKSMLSCALEDFVPRYVEELLQKDIANAVLAPLKAGIAVVGYKATKHEDAMGAYYEHVVRLAPVVGKPSTIRYKLPVVDRDGVFKTNGVKYRLKHQRGDVPIRKTANNRVALTSYYGKCFITRGRLSRQNYRDWALNCLSNALLNSSENSAYSNPVFGNVSSGEIVSSPTYYSISQGVSSFDYDGYRFYFKKQDAHAASDPSLIKQLEVKSRFIVGVSTAGYVLVDNNDQAYQYKDGQISELGSFGKYLGLPMSGSPNETITVGVFGKDIPIGYVLGMKLGLSGLISILGVKYREVPAGGRLGLTEDEYALTFSDTSYVFSRKDRLAAMIIGSYDEYWKTLRAYSAQSFDKPGAYINLLENNGLGIRYSREIDLMFQMFVDPITKDLLEQMNEPTTLRGLLFRAAQMLLDDTYSHEMDGAFMRIKGYERIAGAVYAETVQSIRVHNSRQGKSTAPVEMNPYAVWRRIVEDPSKVQVQEINPIKQIKESEALTYAGTGGRGKRSMTGKTREYLPNDMGLVSESTVDSSDVGINIHMSASPNITTLRGLTQRFDFKRDGAASILSTASLVSVATDQDDMKRANFIAIQQEHTVACEGYHQLTVTTGYDEVIPHRTGDLFCFTAKKPGKVTSLDDKGIIVSYSDDSSEGFELGRRYGNAAGLTLAHSVITDLKEGQSFEVGDAIVYNPGFFEPDYMNPRKVVYKNGLEAYTVLLENSDVFEDGSAVSTKLGERLRTKITKVKTVVVKFDQVVHGLVKVGNEVQADEVLCLIEDAESAAIGAFDEKSIETLKMVSSQSPRSGVKGVVEQVEVFYHGDKEDMSESLQQLVAQSDKERRSVANSSGKKAYTGRVDGGFRIEGDSLPVDSAAIRIYITSDVDYGVGDKAVFSNQLKSVSGDKFEGIMKTESGEIIDACFGAKSVEARTVNSAYSIGLATTLLRVGGKRMAEIYRGTAK